jgi:hypothetical protein
MTEGNLVAKTFGIAHVRVIGEVIPGCVPVRVRKEGDMA